MKDRCDWKLNQAVFHCILTMMGIMEVDLFASQLLRQLLRFTAGGQTPREKPQMPLCKTVPQSEGLRTPHGA